VDLSLFYFSDDAQIRDASRYRLLIDGARFADTHGFSAVWTPERHFNRFGGLYPNPALTAAALALVTERVALRAGSVVAPLHQIQRLAEEWAVVDNLSAGRAGVSLAAGGNRNDFVLRPQAWQDRGSLVVEAIALLRRLWRGEAVTGSLADGTAVECTTYPRPMAGEIPLWLTTGRRTETFRLAGEHGTGVLTHLVGQSEAELTERTAVYRDALARSGTPFRGHVTLMLHTYVDSDADAVEEQVREPLQRYLASALDVGRVAAGRRATADPGADLYRIAVRPAYERYLGHDGLFGDVSEVVARVERYRAAGVDEIACLIDFGVPHDTALRGLERLDEVRRAVAARAAAPSGVGAERG